MPIGKRWNEDRVSSATGRYSTARQRLPGSLVREVTERIDSGVPRGDGGRLGRSSTVCIRGGWNNRVVTEHEPDLIKAYSPGRNQHGENHWPVMQILVMHDVYSGLALAPGWGPMYGARE